MSNETSPGCPWCCSKDAMVRVITETKYSVIGGYPAGHGVVMKTLRECNACGKRLEPKEQTDER